MTKKILIIMIVISISTIFQIFGCYAEESKTAIAVDVQLNGTATNIANFTSAELGAMPQIQQRYSSINASDAPSVTTAKGIALDQFFHILGIDSGDVSVMILSSSDGGLLKYSCEEYFEKPRYYFPEIFGEETAKIEVAPMLALERNEERQGEKPDSPKLNSDEGISFCFGQNAVEDKVSVQYGKYIDKITLILKDTTSFHLPERTFGSGTPLSDEPTFPAGVEERDFAAQAPVAEEDIDRGLTADTLTITVGYYGGPYQIKKTFTLEELYAMKLTEQAYTYIDNMPAVVLESARGVKLADLLNAAGIDINSVESFHFYCSDVKNSWYQSINKEYLLDTIRYYYPKLQENWDYDNGLAGPGAGEGAEEVETIITLEDSWLRFAAEPDFQHLVKKSRFRLVFGQTDLTTRNAYRSARWIHTIEVMLGGKPPESEAIETNWEAAPVPELVGSEYRHDDALGETTGENIAAESSAGVQNWRVYEMSEEAEELQEIKAENPLLKGIGVMAILIFVFGIIVGVIRFYREV